MLLNFIVMKFEHIYVCGYYEWEYKVKTIVL